MTALPRIVAGPARWRTETKLVTSYMSMRMRLMVEEAAIGPIMVIGENRREIARKLNERGFLTVDRLHPNAHHLTDAGRAWLEGGQA